MCACQVWGFGRVAFEYPHSLPLHPSRSDVRFGCAPWVLGRVVEAVEAGEQEGSGGVAMARQFRCF